MLKKNHLIRVITISRGTLRNLNNNQNGIQQISDTLKGRDDLDAIHIISHSDDGTVQLGDILIYGCNLAKTEVGESLNEGALESSSNNIITNDTGSGVDSDAETGPELDLDLELELVPGTDKNGVLEENLSNQAHQDSFINDDFEVDTNKEHQLWKIIDEIHKAVENYLFSIKTNVHKFDK